MKRYLIKLDQAVPIEATIAEFLKLAPRVVRTESLRILAALGARKLDSTKRMPSQKSKSGITARPYLIGDDMLSAILLQEYERFDHDSAFWVEAIKAGCSDFKRTYGYCPLENYVHTGSFEPKDLQIVNVRERPINSDEQPRSEISILQQHDHSVTSVIHSKQKDHAIAVPAVVVATASSDTPKKKLGLKIF